MQSIVFIFNLIHKIGTTPSLEGIKLFETSTINGVDGCSFAGGAEILITGTQMSMAPQNIQVLFANSLFNSVSAGRGVSQDNAFNSDTVNGKLQYTPPSGSYLLGKSLDELIQMETTVFDLSLIDFGTLDSNGQATQLKCPATSAACKLTMSRDYTPILYQISPRVVYDGSEVSFIVDPKNAQRYKQSYEWFFKEAKIGKQNVDFHDFVDESTYISGMTKNQVRGYAVQVPPSESTDISFKFRAGQSYIDDSSALQCSYDNSTCYRAKVVPVIKSVSASSGYTSGGQILEIQGYGLNGQNVNIDIDGVQCSVLTKTLETLTCKTGSNPSPSTETQFVGQQGVKRSFFNSSTINLGNLLTSVPQQSTLALALETPQNVQPTSSGNIFSGYFKPPTSGNYRFYMACDDQCQLSLSTVSMDPSQKQQILALNSHTSYRNYFTSDNSRVSSWIPLEENGYYYVEVLHAQGAGGDHLTVSVELDSNTLAGHHQSMKEIQRVQINPVNIREQSKFIITNPDGGDFTINILNPKTLSYFISPVVNTGSSAATIQAAIDDYYNQCCKASITVTKTMYDSAGAETTTSALSVRNEYLITVNRQLASASTGFANGAKITTNSSMVFQIPRLVQLSSPPLKGSFAIQCKLPDNTLSLTAEIPSTDVPNQIRDKISQACPHFKDKITLWDGSKYGSYDDGREIFIRFNGVNKNIDQLTIVDYSQNPLVGNSITFDSATTSPYSSNLFYEPVPFEFLYTAETVPQILVTVDNLPAVCGSLACGYTYTTTTSEITSFSLSGLTLTISGIDLPTTGIQTIVFGNNQCTISSNSASSITCTLASKTAGSWLPIVTDVNGQIPIAGTASELVVPLSVSSVSPSTGLNPQGENTLTLVGTNFPASLNDGSVVLITLPDGSTKCNVKTTSSTQMTCLTSAYTGTTIGSPITLSVSVNNIVDTTKQVTISSAPSIITNITPNFASPVLKKLLVIQVNNGFVGTLDKDDLEVKFISVSDPSYVRLVNVVEVDNSAKTITVKYGGAISGDYSLSVTSINYGKFDASAINFKAIGIINSYFPNYGSIYGGTLVTIQGYQFSDVITDNPVQIGTTACIVEYTSETEIRCRTQARKSDEIIEPVLVFLKGSEEAQCGLGLSQCVFNWQDDNNIPSLTSYTVDYNSGTNEFEVTLTGTGFPVSTSDVDFKIDGIDQVILSSTATQIKIQISSMLSGSSKNVQLYLPEGFPKGHSQLTTTGITLPSVRPLSMSPSVGYPQGTVITAVVKGVGVASTGVTLIKSDGNTICSSVQITEYGKVKCTTAVANLLSTAIRVKVGTAIFSCSDASLCNYETSLTIPTVASQVISANSLILTGSNFFTSGFSGKVSFAGVEASSVTIDSSTQMTAVWNSGVPLSTAAVKPIVRFESAQTTHWASISQTLTNIPSVTSVNPVTCSFAGGCSLTIDQAGLASSVSQATSQVNVCGRKAELQASQSSATSAVFKIPLLPTVYSASNYQITTEEYLVGTPFSSSTNALVTATAFDGNNRNGFSVTTATCFIGTVFKSGHVGELTEVKFFMNTFKIIKYSGLLKFQASQDGITYSDIFTVGNEIHEGWNYYSFPGAQALKYRYYRFYGISSGACNVGEIGFRGVEVIDNNQNSYTCTAELVLNGGTPIALSGSITYTSTLTPKLTSIQPRYGRVQGGETVTFSGTNFVTDVSAYLIVIDGIACSISSASTTQVSCITGSRPGLVDSSLEFRINGYGNVATQGLKFTYVNYWSNEDTWGGEFQPMEGESVYIPKGLNLLVDVDSTPILQAVLVEGSLIFPPDSNPTHVRKFDAHYVMVKGGYMEVGTEQFPYTSKMIITMHGNKESPELPIYGNKVIGVRQGILELHGIPRTPTWTELETTAVAGSTTITLHTAVDWAVGEQIVIAPTGFNIDEDEVRTIVSIDRSVLSKPVLTLNSPLSFKHYAAVETYGSDTITMRAEVGLLTRNVVFRGDPETSSANQYGGHIMLHSHGDESLIGRIEYIEMQDVGQAFQLGRYPLHFHLIGTVHKSYIRGNSIHHTYNRAVTIHAVHYLRVIQNVAYHTMGHTYFIEDAVETKNLLQENLAIKTRASFSLLNTDQTPACFWITHPDNIFRGNHAAGSTRYGYWFDTKPHPMGPSFDPNICPENAQLGEFTDNVAHSNGKYGLRIFHKLIPRTNPCSPIVFDATNLTDPYWKNPLITANFLRYVGWKNNVNGAIAEQIGDVRFIDFKVSDNKVGGIEASLASETADGTAMIQNALVIGYSANSDGIYGERGIITPRTENYQVNGAKFFNFNQEGQAAIGTCSHCFHSAATDSGARTITFSDLSFDASVTKKIIYGYPWRDILYDTDGTLTGLGANTWATPFFEHNLQSECQLDLIVYDGILCSSAVQVRRLAFHNYQPNIFAGMEMKILRADDSILTPMTDEEKAAYYGNETAYSLLPFKPKLDPSNGWAVPFVTGHKYKIHWRQGLDFTQMQIDLSSKWKTTDKNVYLILNHTDIRAKVDMITGGETIPNNTLTTTANSLLQTGDNVVYNDTLTRQIHLLINGKNTTRTRVLLKGYRCVDNCLGAIIDAPLDTRIRRWSNASDWDLERVPVAGDDVEILPGWNMLYDVADSPIINSLVINGRLTFEDGVKDLKLHAKNIFIRAGELLIGTEEVPFTMRAEIVLHGEKETQYIVFDNAIEAGNKNLVNTNKLHIFGKKRDSMSRLTQTAQPGDQQITVEQGLDWVAGDRLVLLPTTLRSNDSDYAIITSYVPSTGLVNLDRPLAAYHFGQPLSTAADFSGVDMRGEVLMMTRNVKITGEDVQNWGGQIVTSDFVELTGQIRSGNTIIDSVEIYNCSQFDTQKAAIRFEGARFAWSKVSNSAIYHGHGVGVAIINSENVLFQNNHVMSFFRYGVIIGEQSSNITLDGNVVGQVVKRNFVSFDMFVDTTAAVVGCALPGDSCTDIFITNNIAAASPFSGFVVFGHDCGQYSQKHFYNNVAHSNKGTGAVIFPGSSSQKKCMEGSYFSAYKNYDDAAVSFFSTTEVRYSHMVSIDNGYGPTAMVGQEGDQLWAKMNNITIYGESPARDCFYKDECLKRSHDGCVKRNGLMLSLFIANGKAPMPTMAVAIPIHNIMGDGSYGGNIIYEGITFKGFQQGKTWCGVQQNAIGLNPDASDYQPIVKFKNARFENVHEEALVYLMSPPRGWANIDDCGNWPCTAPNNVILSFEGTTYAGTVRPTRERKVFQIISNNTNGVKGFSNCFPNTNWNAYFCENSNLGVLLFESKDDDKYKRMVTPIYVKNAALNTSNSLNTFMDHIWDGFYTSQLRLSRFPSIVQVGQSEQYEIAYTGTAPGNQRFTLKAEYSAIVVKIDYTKPGAYQILNANKVKIAQNKYNDTLRQVDLLRNAYCGENRYIGVVNILEFYITAGCTLYIQPIDAIVSSIRMQWTLDEFYADGGSTAFVDRMAASLGIHASNIKVVSVYQGSVIVRFEISDQNGDIATNQGSIASLKTKLISQIQSKKLQLGAPILSADVSDVPVTIGSSGTSTGSTTNGGTQVKNTDGKAVIITTTTSSSSQDTLTEETDSQTQVTLIIVISVVVGVILIGAAIIVVVYKKYQRRELLKGTNPVKPSENDAQLSQMGGSPGDDNYETQYHPKSEIGNIFGMDAFKKVNQTDNVNDVSKISNNNMMSNTDMAEEDRSYRAVYTNQSQLGGINNEENQLNEFDATSVRKIVRLRNHENTENDEAV